MGASEGQPQQPRRPRQLLKPVQQAAKEEGSLKAHYKGAAFKGVVAVRRDGQELGSMSGMGSMSSCSASLDGGVHSVNGVAVRHANFIAEVEFLLGHMQNILVDRFKPSSNHPFVALADKLKEECIHQAQQGEQGEQGVLYSRTVCTIIGCTVIRHRAGFEHWNGAAGCIGGGSIAGAANPLVHGICRQSVRQVGCSGFESEEGD